MFRIRNPRAGRSLHSFSKSPPPACSPLASFAAASGDGLRRHFLGRIASAPSAFQQATRLSPVMKDAPPTALRSSASAPFSVPGGAPLATSRASQPSATVPAGSRFTPSSGDCGTSPVRTGAPPRNIASLCPSSHRTAGTAAGRLLDRRNPLCRHRRGCAVPWRGTFPNPFA